MSDFQSETNFIINNTIDMGVVAGVIGTGEAFSVISSYSDSEAVTKIAQQDILQMVPPLINYIYSIKAMSMPLVCELSTAK